MEEKKTTNKADLQYLRDYKFNTKFYKAFSKSVRAKLHAVDRDTFIKFCSAIGMIICTRDKDGGFDYLEFESCEDLSRLANLVIQPTSDLELGINLTTGEIIWILPKDDKMRQGRINENDLRYVLQVFERYLNMFFYDTPVQAMSEYYYEFAEENDGDYDEEEMFEQMAFRAWVIAGECYETKFGMTEFFYELYDPMFGAIYICPLRDFDYHEGPQRRQIVYSFDDCATLFRTAKLSDFQNQNELKRFYLDLFESLMASLY